MYHIYREGVNNRVLVLFHGTGGDAKEMLEFGLDLDQRAHILSIEGDVRQWRMNRYFIRHEDGTFDIENLHAQTIKYYEEVLNTLKQFKIENKEVILVGYSNGANLIQSMMKHFTLPFSKVMMFHPSLVEVERPFQAQKDLKVFVTSGAKDQYITMEQFNGLTSSIRALDLKVVTFNHQFGHAMTEEEVSRGRSFVAS